MALNGWNFQPRKQLLSLTSAVRLTLLSWNIEQRRRMWTVTWCGSVAEIHNAPGLRGGVSNRCSDRACIYTHFASLDSSSVFGLGIVVVLFFFSAQLCIYALDKAEVEAWDDSISSLNSSSE